MSIKKNKVIRFITTGIFCSIFVSGFYICNASYAHKNVNESINIYDDVCKVNSVIESLNQEEKIFGEENDGLNLVDINEFWDSINVGAPTLGNNIIESANKYAVPANIVAKMVSGNYNGEGKRVFLTFDDGPSYKTSSILNILKKEQVHATFFVVGKKLSGENIDILKRAFAEGNAIGNHTYTHNYSTLYPHNVINVGSFMGEVYRGNAVLKSILGENFGTRVIRMPGGCVSRKYYNDPNVCSLENNLGSKGMVSIDWNVENGDATGKKYTAQQLINNTIRDSKGINNVILLMHDSGDKEETVKALTGIINYFKDNGYQFKVIKNS